MSWYRWSARQRFQQAPISECLRFCFCADWSLSRLFSDCINRLVNELVEMCARLDRPFEQASRRTRSTRMAMTIPSNVFADSVIKTDLRILLTYRRQLVEIQTTSGVTFSCFCLQHPVGTVNIGAGTDLGKTGFVGWFTLKNIKVFNAAYTLRRNFKLRETSKFRSSSREKITCVTGGWVKVERASNRSASQLNCRFIQNRSILYLVNGWNMIVWVIKSKLKEMIAEHSIRYRLLIILYSLQLAVFLAGGLESTVWRKLSSKKPVLCRKNT